MSLFLKILGAGGAAAEVDPVFDGLRVTQFPVECLGGYRYSGVSGLVTGVAANGELFQMRWSDTANLALIDYVRVRSTLTTAFTAAQELIHEIILAAAWSVSGTGGTAITPSATNLAKRSSFPQSKIGDMRIASTAALGVGTKTLYGNALAAQHGWAGAQGQTAIDLTIDLTNGGAEYPVVLAQNEGLVIRNGVAMGAGGVMKTSVEIAWREIAASKFPTF